MIVLYDLIQYILTIFSWIIIIQAILSWVSPYSPLMPLASQLTRPFTNPIRRVVPPVANIDLSPWIAIVLAQLVLIFLR